MAREREGDREIDRVIGGRDSEIELEKKRTPCSERIPPATPPTFLRRLIGALVLVLVHHKGRVLLLGDAHVVAGVILLHDVPRPGIEQYRFLVELGQLRGSHTD